MTVCLAQLRSDTGDVERNIGRHMAALQSLAPGSAGLVAFPELSLSNYDPDAARAAAIEPTDVRLKVFQRYADVTGTALAVGAPLATPGKPTIAMLVFVPGRGVVVAGKRHLHADEVPYFSPSEGAPTVLHLASRVGVAICYEISVPEHTAAVMACGPEVYLASVAKTPSGVEAALAALSATARRHSVPALMVNSVGTCEGQAAGGGSLAVDEAGRLLGQLGGVDEGLLCFDVPTQTVTLAEDVSGCRA